MGKWRCVNCNHENDDKLDRCENCKLLRTDEDEE